jgi:UDP:flavonoid glycosyltransferase YjiC (YdhE family)
LPSSLPDGRLRILIGAFGDPGHAFPAIALGKALTERGHDVTLQTWTRWQADAEREGMRFAAAPEYQVFPTRERPLKPYAAAARAALETSPLIKELSPDAVVNDVLTLAPALAAEIEGRPLATLIPHFYPPPAPGLPPYGIGATER